jgi:hypothetical protein
LWFFVNDQLAAVLAGLLPAFAAACSALADTLQQQQQDAATLHTLLRSSSALLQELYRCIAEGAVWDSMLDDPLRPTVQPVVRLLLQHLRAASRTGLSYEEMHQQKMLGNAHLLSELFVQDLGAAFLAQQQQQPGTLLPLLESGDALQLVLAHTACVAAAMHGSRSGKSPLSASEALCSRGFGKQLKQRLLVPAYHCDLFAAVGMDRAFQPELAAMGVGDEDERDKAVVDCFLALGAATNIPFQHWENQQQRALQWSAEAARRQAATAAAVRRAIPPPTVKPLLHVVLQLQLLQPKLQHVGVGMQHMMELLFMQLAYVPADLVDELYTSLAQPLLHLLGPAALYVCRELQENQQQVLAHYLAPLLWQVPESGG